MNVIDRIIRKTGTAKTDIAAQWRSVPCALKTTTGTTKTTR